MKNDTIHFRGCLLGGAIGDALGYAVEFMNIDEIKHHFGNNGIIDLQCDNKTYKALISDDTQMTIFTADGLLWADKKNSNSDIESFIIYMYYSYQRWLYTQRRHLESKELEWILDCDILKEKALFVNRAPGHTCLSALINSSSKDFGTIKNKRNNSKGCGGVMRIAPVGLRFHATPGKAFKLAAECAAITHGHPSGYLSAGAVACIIAEIINGKEIEKAVLSAIEILKTYDGHEEILNILQNTMKLSKSEINPYEAVVALGQGWVGEEALAIAVYCALKYRNDFEKAICLSVNHSGDSDSTGAITGNILGAYLGIEKIPGKWINNIEFSDLLINLANMILKIV